MQRCFEAGQFPGSFVPFLPCVDPSGGASAELSDAGDLDPLISSRVTGGGGARPGHVDILDEKQASRSDIGYSLGTASPQIGWAHDGFPLMGPIGPDGALIKACGATGALHRGTAAVGGTSPDL